ncbi:MAG: CotH kinase family protein [Planctomycetota bacterium]
MSLLAVGPSAQQPGPTKDPATALFSGSLLSIAMELSSDSAAGLRAAPRTYVQARVTVAGQPSWTSVGIKLKGSAGSFQSLDDRPGFTLDLDRFGDAPEFHGLKKFHLNNGAQDASLLHEWLGAQVFTDAGYPAPRVAHAHVTLDGRNLGFYVLRESFDSVMESRCFGTAGGNLYDGGFCQDIDADLEKDGGKGPEDRSDLRRLLDACRTRDAAERRESLATALDVDALIDFVALEAMLGHWDGYSLNRNNYRLCFRSTDGRAVFLPHGMDQLFGDADASILSHPPSIVAGAVLADPVWRKQYRARIKALLPLFESERLKARVQSLERRLVPAMRKLDEDGAREHEGAVQELLTRIRARQRSLVAQSTAPDPRPIEFRGSRPVAIKGWHPAGETDGVELKKRSIDGASAYAIACVRDGQQQGAWRTTVLLAEGRYRLVAQVRTQRLKVEDPEHEGAYLAVDDARSVRIGGDQRWQEISCEFTVAEPQRDVELALRVRAQGGIGGFRVDSLQLVHLED